MLVSEFLQFPNKFLENEKNLFTEYESSNLINLYQSMMNINLTRSQKIDRMKQIIIMCENLYGKERKKIICLLTFSVLQTDFGRSLLQENEKFRQVVFSRYEEFMSEDDQDFVEKMRELRI